MAERILTYRGIVYPWQCDHVGHMNVMWYVSKFDEATWQLLATIGLTASYLRRQGRAMAAVHQEITYRRELLPGDRVTIRSGILEVRERVIRFFHEMINDETGEVAAVAVLTGVHMDAEARAACPFPEEIWARGRERIVAYPGTEP
jgi:acyl-CoA thioester hydrolase